MIPKDILKQIRRIHITTSRLVTDVFAGQYHSVFKGRGMEFDEVRQYYPGDDIRSIDWNVTARTGEPYVKKFIEERELTVMFLVDLSKSVFFGTVNKLKRHLAAEICALLSFAAMENNDKTGLIAFSDRIERFVPPGKGLRHCLRIIREALYLKPQGKKTSIFTALDYFNRVCKRRTVCFIISDFYDRGFEKLINILNKRHDITAITITDPREIELPDLGIINFKDPETGREFLIDTSSRLVRNNFKSQSLELLQERSRLFKRLNISHIDIRTDVPYSKTLFSFFRMREKMFA